jgi:two-component system, chemotaxis family, sensor kinase CheA
MTEPRRARYVALFAAESRTLLTGARRALQEWLDAPESHAPSEELFRALHTVKGMAASLGFDETAELTHATETELGEVREGSRVADRPWLRRLERSVDAISAACEHAVAIETGTTGAENATTTEGSGPRYVRVDLDRLDALLGDLGGLVTARQELDRHAAMDTLSPLARAAQGVERRLDQLRDRILDVRLAPLSEVFERLPPMVRDLARQLGKEVAIEVSGEEIEVDRTILEQLIEPLIHLLRNAVDHAIESPEVRLAGGKRPNGRISLRARRDGESVVLEVSDDGKGIDRDRIAEAARERGLLEAGATLGDDGLLTILAHAGFTTAASVTDVSGRGVGLDAVVARLHGVGASLALTTVLGKGTAFSIRLPTRIGIVRAMVTTIGTERYVLPLTHINELMAWEPGTTRTEGGRTVLDVRGDVVPVVDLRRLLGFRGPDAPLRRPAIVIEANGQRVALLADAVLGHVDAVVQPLERPKGMPRWVTGAAVLDDGRPALMLDLASVV